jgi:hypothetical protein
MLLNFAMGGAGGGGTMAADSFFPKNGTNYMWEQVMETDWVRVHALDNGGGGGGSGTCNGEVCCAESCGAQCGGTGCGELPGGASNCCTGTIQSSGVSCDDDVNPSNAPCIKTGGGGGGSTLLNNSTFSGSLSGWTTNLVSGSLTWWDYEGGIARADMVSVAANRWDNRIYQDVNVTAGKTYTASVKLRHAGTGSEPVYLVVEKNGSPWTKHIDRTITLTSTTWGTHTGTFTAPVSEQVRVQMMLGHADAGVRIDDFKFCEGTSCN